MVENQLGFAMLNEDSNGNGYNYSKNVLGQLFYKYVNQSYGIMEEVLPLETTSRNLARYNKESSTTCSDYVSAAVTDPATVT